MGRDGGHIQTARLLLDRGADVNAKDREGKTALIWAEKRGHTEIVELLREVAGMGEPSFIGSINLPDGVELIVSLSSTRISPGDTVDIRVILTNLTGDSLTLHFNTTCQIVFGIANSRGEVVVPESGWICGMALTELHLGPNGSRQAHFQWTGIQLEGEPFPPGVYYVFGALGQMMEIRSDPVELVLESGL